MKHLQLVLRNNQRRLLSVRQSLLQWFPTRSFDPGNEVMAKKTKRKLAHPTLPMQRQLNLRHEGTHFDLHAIFERLNERYFRGRLRGYKVMWGRRRRHRRKEYFILGTIQEEESVIRINP